jgi:anhydro-N-acetylmuramic acid kinase
MSKIYKEIFSMGLMSGTSMDGINVSLVKTNGIQLNKYNLNKIKPYSKKTLNLLNKIISNLPNALNNNNLLSEASKLVTIDHLKCIKVILKETSIKPEVIGFHGQTIYHNPKKKISIQLGDPKLLSDLLNINVVGNFRKQDIENGGEGAPIAPIYHKQIMEKLHLDLPCCFLNIGGVSNISYWDGEKLIGFDCGPGNALMDIYMQQTFQVEYDNLGELASKGEVIKEILDVFLKDNYFKNRYPKSLDRLHFSYILNIINNNNYVPKNIMATLSELTVQSIILALNNLPHKPKNIYIIGGGALNLNLVNSITNIFSNNVLNANSLGLNGEMIEAELIAYLAVRKLYNFPSTFPETTGVLKPTCLGELFLNKKDDFI